jgi:arginine-tRNA-protein transferase
LSLGRYSIYKQIEFAKEMGLKWIYLGYAVENCDSLNYKFDYKPQKRLINNPDLEDEAIWL